ncbi:hypothetical protein DZA50_01415 [Kangiella sp. HD9-110m-PIT-SAG07]|nr:hypothetical protein DZA50_01415 [Kangiella sp. HD9-110m-PIT-SAG07]
MKTIILILSAFLTTACVQLKAPERIISDTYRTGKEIYHDISDSDGEKRFVHEIVMPKKADVALEKERCVDELVGKAREKYSIESYEVNKIVHTEGSTDTIYCEIKASLL